MKLKIQFAHFGVGDGTFYCGFETAVELLEYVAKTTYAKHDKLKNENLLFDYETGIMFKVVRK